MSHLRAIAARAYAALFSALISLLSLRDRAIAALLLLPATLLPGAAMANGDLADMAKNVSEGAKVGQSSSLDIAQFVGVILFIGGLVGFKKVGKQPGVTLAGCIVSIIVGACLAVIPEVMNRSQRQLGTSATTIS